MNVTEGSVTAGYGMTAGGDPNTDLTAVINLPLIADTLAVRARHLQRPARRLHQQRAGHFHAQGDRSRHPQWAIIRWAVDAFPAATPCQVPPDSDAINNNAIAANAINPVTYQGMRVSALWDINSD